MKANLKVPALSIIATLITLSVMTQLRKSVYRFTNTNYRDEATALLKAMARQRNP